MSNRSPSPDRPSIDPATAQAAGPGEGHPGATSLVAYATGALDRERARVVLDHCLDCRSCDAKLAALIHLRCAAVSPPG